MLENISRGEQVQRPLRYKDRHTDFTNLMESSNQKNLDGSVVRDSHCVSFLDNMYDKKALRKHCICHKFKGKGDCLMDNDKTN